MADAKVRHLGQPSRWRRPAARTFARHGDRSRAQCYGALVADALVAFAIVERAAISYVSPALLRLLHAGVAASAPPEDLDALIAEADRPRIVAALAAGTRYSDTCNLRRADGTEVCVALDIAFVRTREGTRILLIATDFSAWALSNARLRRLAFTDSLTGLANRAVLEEHIGRAIAAARRDSGTGALLLIDIDRFKAINDMLGHAAGDRAICESARRIVAATRAVDTVARLGGDEFVVLLGGDSGDAEATRVAERVVRAFESPLEECGWRVGVSVGITLFPLDGDDAQTILARADGAMYAAKARGGSCHAYANQIQLAFGVGAAASG